MTIHAAPGDNYPTTTCKVSLALDVKSASIAGVSLTIPKADPRRILLIGDTGCRIKGKLAQARNDPVQWPFARVAELAAQQKPDLIIHVGDYHYRESPCPEGFAGCAASPFGDNWDVWRADFFAPAGTLLRAAPWVFARGNHEECDRGGKGWSRTLEPNAFDVTKACNGLAKPYTVQLPGLSLVIMDVSSASERKIDDAQVTEFAAQFAFMADKGPAWVILHKPIWSTAELEPGKSAGANVTLAAAGRTAIPANVQALLSGHHHTFQALSYDALLPAQIVSGHGGDYLNEAVAADPAGMIINDIKIKAGISLPSRFGFAMLEKQDGGWRIVDYEVEGKVLALCDLKGREVSCAPAT